MTTPIQIVIRKIKRRVAEVLTLGLPPAIADDPDIIAAPDLAELALVPAQEDVWITPAPALDDLFLDRNVALIISQTRPTDYPIKLTGSAFAASMVLDVYLSIALVFEPAACQPILLSDGRRLRLSEITDLIADLYRGAILTVLLRDAADGQVILNITPISDLSDQIQADTQDRTYGRAILEVAARAHAHHPTARYDTAREV